METLCVSIVEAFSLVYTCVEAMYVYLYEFLWYCSIKIAHGRRRRRIRQQLDKNSVQISGNYLSKLYRIHVNCLVKCLCIC